ncbi:hypothetical protein TPY_1955 [Sulfobacillus acidophilus TPY]|nr:hypothetical protein TPY_1955 [Sulfobacillus acidophilus TPY]
MGTHRRVYQGLGGNVVGVIGLIHRDDAVVGQVEQVRHGYCDTIVHYASN